MKALVKFFKKYHEFLTIPVVFGIWFLIEAVIKLIDPTAGEFDAGIFQIPVFTIIQAFLYISMAWIILGIVFTRFQTYLQTEMKCDFKDLTPWQRITLVYSVYFALLFLLAALSKTLIAGR